MSKYFDSTADGMARYFVCPNDDFILNSLERLNRDEFLYRVLHQDGYQRVLICEHGQTNIDIYAYDKLSHLSFLNPEPFKEVNPSDEGELTKFYDSVEKKGQNTASGLQGLTISQTTPAPKSQPEKQFGKRLVHHSGTPEEFLDVFRKYVVPAVQSSNIKTAIVIQLEAFEQSLRKSSTNATKTASYFVNAIRECERNNRDRENIFVFTTTSRSNLEALATKSESIKELFSHISESGRNNTSVVDILKERDCIVLADIVGLDEIANLIIRKKVVEGVKEFNEIPFNKVYAIADMLRRHIIGGESIFKSIPSDRKVDEVIRVLNSTSYLKNKKVIRELIDVSKTVESQDINAIEGIEDIRIERLTHEPVDYVDISDAQLMAMSDKAMAQLNALIGLADVKAVVQDSLAERLIYADDKSPGHYIFAGSPGTGKTEVARLMGKIFKAQGLLKSGHLVEVRKADLVGQYIGESSIKTRKKCEEALDGVLFVDEAYELVNCEPTGEKFKSSFDEDAYTEIMAQMENNRNRLCVIFAGYKDKMEIFKVANPGMKDRISRVIAFADYTKDELLKIFKKIAADNKFSLADNAEEAMKECIARKVIEGGDTFSNGRAMRNLFVECRSKITRRYRLSGGKLQNGEKIDPYVITVEDIPNSNKKSDGYTESLAWDDLNKLIGLDSVKSKIKTISNKVKFAAKKEHKAPGHYVFVGNPGTGKTVVARLFSQMFKSIGVLSQGHCVEVTRAELVSGYVNQTAIKTKAKCQEALGGVLFVDEAYTLFDGDSSGSGKEAVETIMKFMEDYRSNFCVIFAGYRNKMENLYRQNDGLRSRITDTIEFPDYSLDDLMNILGSMAKQEELAMDEGFRTGAREVFNGWLMFKTSEFGNAREVRKFLEKADENRANRLAAMAEAGNDIKEEEFNLLVRDDVPGLLQTDEEPHSASNKVQYERISASDLSLLKPRYTVDDSVDEQKLRALVKPSVIYIQTDKGSGTGFIISPEGYAITCNHVIEGAGRIDARVRIEGRAGGKDSIHKCKVINANKAVDMALIKLDGENFPCLTLAEENRKIEDGEMYTLSGYPLGENKDITTYTGRIANENGITDDKGIKFYFVEGEAKKGNSGSPIVSIKDGKVIGILIGSWIDGHDEMNQMRPIEYFWNYFTM